MNRIRYKYDLSTLCEIVLVLYYTTVLLSTYPCSCLYRTSYTVASLILALLGINLYIRKATFLLLLSVPFYCRLFSSISLSVCLIPFGMSLTFLFGLLSAVLIAVAFRHLATKPSFYFACFYFYLAVFSRRGYCRLAAIVLAAWVVVPFFTSFTFLNSSCHYYCHAIFIAAVHFDHCRPFYRCSARHQSSRLFIQGWTLSCRFCSGPVIAIFILLLKTFSLGLYIGRRPVLLFLFFWLSFFSSFSRRHAVPIVTV